jgi:hypothetical protein
MTAPLLAAQCELSRWKMDVQVAKWIVPTNEWLKVVMMLRHGELEWVQREEQISLFFSQFAVLLMIAGRRRRQDVLFLPMFREHCSNEIAFLTVQPDLLS